MSENRSLIFHLLPNAHIDPVWLWDWREGLNEGLITVRTVLDLMDEFPELTFMRGESSIYQHIQKTDPATFRRILQRIEDGRWDVVGGTVVQTDTLLPSTEVLCRQFERGLDYFERNLGGRPTVAWLADSFGHSAGLPNILSAFGMKGFCFTRPQQNEFPLNSPAFWWEGDWKNRIFCYRQHWQWYCNERENLPEVLDKTLEGAQKLDFKHSGVLFGLGNHGGGPTRRHMEEIAQWRQLHPEVDVRFSTLHGFFAEAREEVAAKPEGSIPSLRGEFGFCLRGCYSSVQKFKSLYRNGESQIAGAEVTRSIIGASTESVTPDLKEAWDALLFNAFHDILPGSSIERAFDDQIAWMGLATHRAQEAKFVALNLLASKIDTTVPPARHPDVATDVPVVVWNPLPRPFIGLAEAEVSVDWRPIWKFKDRPSEMPVVVFDHANRPAPFQIVDTEHTALADVPWRRRVIVPVKIPAFGWTVLRVGWRDEPEAQERLAGTLALPAAQERLPGTLALPATQERLAGTLALPACHAERDGGALRINNAEWALEAGDGIISIRRNGENFFSAQRNMEIRVLEDPWGSWGGLFEKADAICLKECRETWRLAQSEILESGPLRAKLWTRWQGKNSWLDLTFILAAGSPELKVAGRMLWNERSARVELVLPCQGDIEFDVPGGKVSRNENGQVPGGRWAVRSGQGKTMGFASDVLGDFNATPEELRVTLARASRYANSVRTSPTEKVWQPAVDCGELKFQCCLFAENAEADHVADALLFAPTAIPAPPGEGSWGRNGSLGELTPDSMRLLSLDQCAAGELRVRIQNRSRETSPAVLKLGTSTLKLGELGPEQIKTFIFKKGRKNAVKKAWKLKPHHVNSTHLVGEKMTNNQ